ncbi:CPBP family intramembrane metalloprotease domain-containing protein, partial [Streptomyces sp. SID6013]|nr:CPBP family intramembrane metalloprotease domain-containing protein [Streptomyces sp. SID6013]
MAEAGPVDDAFPQKRLDERSWNGERLSRRILRDETLLVLALSLGASGVSALISFIGSVTRPGGLKDQAATLNASAAPGRPWLDLAWQLFGITTALVPVALVAHF